MRNTIQNTFCQGEEQNPLNKKEKATTGRAAERGTPLPGTDHKTLTGLKTTKEMLTLQRAADVDLCYVM